MNHRRSHHVLPTVDRSPQRRRVSLRSQGPRVGAHEWFLPGVLLTLWLQSYFVNDEDEIRSIESPDTYFKYHVDLLERVNDRQRFAFNSEHLATEKRRTPTGRTNVLNLSGGGERHS